MIEQLDRQDFYDRHVTHDELLDNIIYKLNEVIDQVNRIEQDFHDLKEAVQKRFLLEDIKTIESVK